MAIDTNGKTAVLVAPRLGLLCLLQVIGLLPNGILAVWPASIALKKFAFLTVNMHLVTAVLYVVLCF